MLEAVQQTGFKKDIKRLKNSGRHDLELLKNIVLKLCMEKELDTKHHDHYLSGNWNGYKECHITPDWLLIYRIKGTRLELARTGSHSELFE